MSSIIIKGMEMPTSCCQCPFNMYLCKRGYEYLLEHPSLYDERAEDCPLVSLPPHGRLIDADALRQTMYHEAFETDSAMQKWDSGCWIRYKMFESAEENAPTIIPAEEGE